MSQNLNDLVYNLGQPTILVLGDIILDRYIFGCAERISQEAPVPILRADRKEDRLGGAASVASMLSTLGAEVLLAGVVGQDDQVPSVQRLLRQYGISQDVVLADPERPTTLKERYIGRASDRHPQQLIRIDYEVRTPLSAPCEDALLRMIGERLDRCDIVLISDYDKGVCTIRVLRELIAMSKARGLRVLVDPLRGGEYSRYRGANCLTPNRVEAHLGSGMSVKDPVEALDAADHLRQMLDAEAMIVTLDKEGMAFVHGDGRRQLYPTRSRQVYDITGAGDMVLTVLGLTLAAGADWPEAIALANVAGGLEVERLGVATLTREDLLRDLEAVPSRPRLNKFQTASDLLIDLDKRRRLGQRIVFTNGCFDILHAGHIRYLRQARDLGDCLVVGLNSDTSVSRLKGSSRPVNNQDLRAEVLAALGCVDYITVFEEDTPLKLIDAIRPHVLVKGADYKPDQVVGRDLVEASGGQVVLIPLVAGQSTTRLVPHVTNESLERDATLNAGEAVAPSEALTTP